MAKAYDAAGFEQTFFDDCDAEAVDKRRTPKAMSFIFEEPDHLLDKIDSEKKVGSIETDANGVPAGPPPGLGGATEEAPMKVEVSPGRMQNLRSAATSRARPLPGEDHGDDDHDDHDREDFGEQAAHRQHGPPSRWPANPWQMAGPPPGPCPWGPHTPGGAVWGPPGVPPASRWGQEGAGTNWPQHPQHMYGDDGMMGHMPYHGTRWPVGPPMGYHPGLADMNPREYAIYLSGLYAGSAGGVAPPHPGHYADAPGVGQRRRAGRPTKPEATVPYPQPPALEPAEADQMRNDLEVWWLQRKLDGAVAAKERAELEEKLGKLKPKQKTGEQVIQLFKTRFQEPQGALLSLAFDKDGCRLVQAMLDFGDPDTTKKMHVELAPAVRDMAGSPHANYVVTKMIEVAPAESVSLIIKHLREHAEQIARHRYGCRIICRLLQRSYKRKQENPSLPELEGLEELLKEVLNKAQALCCHIFAHHVIQSVLENTNNPEHKNKIFEALNGELQRCAQDRHASFVIQAALKCCRPCDVNRLADGLIDMLPSLATTRFGSYVYNTLCVHEDPDIKARAIGALRQAKDQLQDNTHGTKLVKQVLENTPPQEASTVKNGKPTSAAKKLLDSEAAVDSMATAGHH